MRILIVDDIAENRYLLRAMLQHAGYEVDEAANGAQALETASRRAPDLVISDLMMPEIDGFMLLRRWRSDERLRLIPFLVYTATYTEPRDEQLALDLGADAFWIKPIEATVLLERIQGLLAKGPRAGHGEHAQRGDESALFNRYGQALLSKLQARNEQLERSNRVLTEQLAKLKQAQERIEFLAQHDELTGLANRALLTDRLDLALRWLGHSVAGGALLMLDLDRFTIINDSFGHRVGDLALKEIARRLQGCVGALETVSRQGGDSFYILVSDTDSPERVTALARALLAAISEPLRIGDDEIVLAASIGIACFPQSGTDAGLLLRKADIALQAAKAKGRGSYCFYTSAMEASGQDRLALEGDLRRAVERAQLFLVYQPQVALTSGSLIGHEALVRWRHPTRGVIPPGIFIQIAEDSGLINEIGSWVMEAACRQQALWTARHLVSGSVAINVSAHQFRQADFVRTVADTLARTGLRPDRLELEVTERVVMDGIEEVRTKLDQLHALGVKLAIDDFGTGYSSLSYLKQFPLHRLKIDQSFTFGLPNDRESVAIAQAVINLGHSLGLDVIAEGVETAAQESCLRGLGCDEAQGYFYARPMMVDAFEEFAHSYSEGARYAAG